MSVVRSPRARRGAVNWKILVGGLLLIAPLLWVLYSGFGKDPHALPSTMEGRVAPPFALQDMDGNPVSLESLRGTPVVINFWATWCVPCKQEHPYLQEAARAYEGRVRFLGVLYGDEPATARAFLGRYGSSYPTLVDADQSTAIDYGVAGVPETFFVNAEGQIVRKVSGPVNMAVLVETLESMR